MTKMSDEELTQLVRDWWNAADEDDRRWSIYYSQTDIDDYSWVWFIQMMLKIPGYDCNHISNEQREFCRHICCDILGKLTEPLFNKSL